MKKDFAALFFYLLYMIAMMRPVMPVLEYYANNEYIVTVLCENRDKPAMACNGKCYLEKELAKVSGESSNKHEHSNKAPHIDLSKYPVSPLSVSEIKLKALKLKKQKTWRIANEKPKTKNNSVFRPPLFRI